MARGATFDELFATTAPPEVPAEQAAAPARRSWLRSWEDWVSLLLVMLVQVPVIGSLQSANWVDEMPSLAAAAWAGVAGGWLLAQSRLRALFASVAGLIVTVVVVVGLVLHTMERVEHELGDGVRGALWEFWLRLKEWGAALIGGGISADPLPFVLLMVAIVFVVAYLSAWSVVRWRNPWAALVPGGVVLLTNISYLPGQPSIAFIIYMFAAVLLVTRMHFLQSVRRWRLRRVYAPEGMSLDILVASSVVAVGLILFAWLVPTANNWGPVSEAWLRFTAPVQQRVDALGNVFIGIRAKRPLPVHAFGAAMPLQGRVSLDTVPLFEVLADEPGALRGAVYDEYTGAGWRLSDSAALPLPGVGVEVARYGTAETRAQVRRPFVAEISVVGENVPDGVLLVTGDPMATDSEAALLLGPAAEPFGLIPVRLVRPGARYTTVGSISVAAVPTLEDAGRDYPAGLYEQYTRLPADLPPEVHELAQSVVGDAATPYEAARRIEAHLRERYRFTLGATMPPPRRDAVSHFLFDEQAGYFDHFASAMAVMLRTVGIPSRMAVGFVLDERDMDPDTKAFVVSEQRAWAWPEVYFPALGWVEFNPTPARPLVQRPGDDHAALQDRAAALGGDTPFFDDLFLDEWYLLEEQGLLGDGSGMGALDPLDEAGRTSVGSILARMLTWLFVLSAVGLVVLLIARFFWERSFRALPPLMRRWAKVQRLAHWAGISPAVHRTPAEGARDLAVALDDVRALEALAWAYTRARYGRDGEESQEQAPELEEHYRRVRGRLWTLVLRRIVHMGRVPDRLLPGRHAVLRPGGR